jgi:hypothetical protein
MVIPLQVAEGYKNVAALLSHLNVDASNPLAVLTQVRVELGGAAHFARCWTGKARVVRGRESVLTRQPTGSVYKGV